MSLLFSPPFVCMLFRSLFSPTGVRRGGGGHILMTDILVYSAETIVITQL